MWSERARGAAALCVLPLLVLAVYAPALRGYFAADDFLWVIHDTSHDAWQALAGSWGLGVAWRPLARLDFWADARLFGWDAWPWHAVNLALHAANGVLLALLGRRLGQSSAAAWLAAAMFLTLPMGWENVDWISGRTGLLCLLFLLLSALCLGRGRRGLFAACLCQALALLAYEPAAVFPAVVLVAAWPCRGRAALAPAAWLGACVAALWLTRWIVLGSVSVGTDVAAGAYLPQLWRNLLGIAAHLWRGCGAAGLGLPVLLALGWARPARRPLLAGLMAAAVLLYLPFSPVAGFTERFFYLSSAPLALALGAAVASRRMAEAALAAMICAFAWRSHGQASEFARAGTTVRQILAGVAAAPGHRVVFDQVPTHQGPYYLLWANFEDAAAFLRHVPEGLAATSAWVLLTPQRLQPVLAEDTAFYAWDEAAGRFRPMTRGAWMARHGLAR